MLQCIIISWSKQRDMGVTCSSMLPSTIDRFECVSWQPSPCLLVSIALPLLYKDIKVVGLTVIHYNLLILPCRQYSIYLNIGVIIPIFKVFLKLKSIETEEPWFLLKRYRSTVYGMFIMNSLNLSVTIAWQVQTHKCGLLGRWDFKYTIKGHTL